MRNLIQLVLTCLQIQILLSMDEDGDMFDRMISEEIDRSEWLDPFSMELDETEIDLKKFCQADCHQVEDKLEVTARELVQCQEAYRRLEETHRNKSAPKVPDSPSSPSTNSQPTSKLKKSGQVTLKSSGKIEKEIPATQDKNCSCPKPQTEVREIYLQRFVSYLIKTLDIDSSDNAHLNVEIILSASRIRTLMKFRQDQIGAYEVDKILTSMIQSVQPHITRSKLHVFKEMMHDIREPLQDVALALGLALAVIFTFRYFSLWKIFLVFVLVSVSWHWTHMYKDEWAIKKSKLVQNLPPECSVEDMSWTMSAFYYWKSGTSWTDKCDDYHKALLVDPIYEVNPLMAFSDLASKIILRPIRNFGKELGAAYKELLKDLPWQVQIAVFCVFSVLLAIVFFLVVVFQHKYTIRLPFFLEMKPPSSVSGSLTAEDVKQIKAALESNKRLENDGYQQLNFMRSGVQTLQGEVNCLTGNPAPERTDGHEHTKKTSLQHQNVQNTNLAFHRQMSEPVIVSQSSPKVEKGLTERKVQKKVKRRLASGDSKEAPVELGATAEVLQDDVKVETIGDVSQRSDNTTDSREDFNESLGTTADLDESNNCEVGPHEQIRSEGKIQEVHNKVDKIGGVGDKGDRSSEDGDKGDKNRRRDKEEVQVLSPDSKKFLAKVQNILEPGTSSPPHSSSSNQSTPR
eukprot:TRINITY_DN9049_c0_g1_i5.p1 TRINITY_DN9049_c0_g1~~TRINITY_DN9049_c0_g1_i5.p1  ORF type:complete len:685 (-),score=109.25 TRINITY_DN9049_c0_g1_i5:454-2508(-)